MELFTKLFGDFLVFVYHCFSRPCKFAWVLITHLQRPPIACDCRAPSAPLRFNATIALYARSRR